MATAHPSWCRTAGSTIRPAHPTPRPAPASRCAPPRSSADHKPDYLAVNPNGTIPALRHGDTVLTDSTPTMEYIDTPSKGPHCTPPTRTGAGGCACASSTAIWGPRSA
ncbi:MAG TPA: glutathione S-transferase N-terminal domain-containing protein [Sphingobium sp.]|nr:glutathione S-transferase N-terminal domain-containing protein [Sphingobium sp.]